MLNSWNGLKVRDFGELLETQTRHLSLFSSLQHSPRAELVTAPSHTRAEMSPPHSALHTQPDQLHLARDPWQMSLRGDSFSSKELLQVPVCFQTSSAALPQIIPPTDKPQNQTGGTTQQWRLFANEDKSHKITGQKAPGTGDVQRCWEKNPLTSSHGQSRAPSMQRWCSLLDTDCTSQRGKEAPQDELKLLSWLYF